MSPNIFEINEDKIDIKINLIREFHIMFLHVMLIFFYRTSKIFAGPVDPICVTVPMGPVTF